MRRLTGVLCCVFFLISIAAAGIQNLADNKINHTNLEAEDCETRTLDCEFTRQDRAIKLEVATTDNCYWCDLLESTTLPRLEKAGYQVTITDGTKRGVSDYPTLFYIGWLGQVTHVDVGYRTYNQIIEHLEKT